MSAEIIEVHDVRFIIRFSHNGYGVQGTCGYGRVEFDLDRIIKRDGEWFMVPLDCDGLLVRPMSLFICAPKNVTLLVPMMEAIALAMRMEEI